MNLVLQTFNETIEFLPGYEVKDHDNLTPFSDKAAALVFLHRVAAYLHDMSALRTLLAKEGNGINVSQLNDSQMLEVLADRLRYGRIKVRRTPKLGSPSATGMSSEQQYMTPREVEQLEKKRRRERGLILPIASKTDEVTEAANKTDEIAKAANKVDAAQKPKLEKHLKDVEAHRQKYERKLAESEERGDTKHQQGAYKAKITESIGEKAAAEFMQKNHSDYEMIRGFEVGIGYDQVYVKRDSSGKVTEILIVEAKGPNAKLGNPKKGRPQMSKKWVKKTAEEMQCSGNTETRQLGEKIHNAIANPPPKVTGKVIQAIEGGGAQEILCPDNGTYN